MDLKMEEQMMAMRGAKETWYAAATIANSLVLTIMTKMTAAKDQFLVKVGVNGRRGANVLSLVG